MVHTTYMTRYCYLITYKDTSTRLIVVDEPIDDWDADDQIVKAQRLRIDNIDEFLN